MYPQLPASLPDQQQPPHVPSLSKHVSSGTLRAHPVPAPGRAGERGWRQVLRAGISRSQVAVKETALAILKNCSCLR